MGSEVSPDKHQVRPKVHASQDPFVGKYNEEESIVIIELQRDR